MKLFMLITACDASVLYTFSISTRVCDLNLHKLFMWTTQFAETCDSMERSLRMQMNAAAFIKMFCNVFGLYLQMAIAVDLILTIRRPFTPKENRMPIYIFIASVAAIFQSTMMTWFHIYGEKTIPVKIGGIFAMVS